jgi:16S rRNA (uracil1498-N3)-methyltransferase
VDRFEWFLEKATEIGIDRITPVITEHSERRRLRHDRSLKVLIAAMKQSQRTWLPQLDELTPLPHFLGQELPARRAFGWCTGEHGSFMNWYQPQDSIILIGPEGDFSADEAQQLQQTGFAPVSIGNSRLRTETAGVAVCTWMSLSQQS